MYPGELQIRSAAKTRTRWKIKGRKATKIKTSPGREGWFWCRDFSGGKFCKSDESRLSWAAGVRPPGRAPQPVAGELASWRPGGGAHAGGANSRRGRDEGRGGRDPDRLRRGSKCAGKKVPSQRALLLYRNHKCTRSRRNVSQSLGYSFRRPFNFPCLGVFYAKQTNGF